MKTQTQDYIDKEEAVQRKPAELYHFFNNGETEHWYYTDGDISVDYGGNTYSPAALSRGAIRYNTKLEAQTLDINFSYLEDAAIDFISINPVEIIWAEVLKIHRDQSPLETSVVFIGQIKTVSYKGVTGKANCVGFEYFLKKTIPTWRYQLNCNHNVFDSKCALTKASYKTTTTVSADSTGLILTSADFGAKADGYFTGGEVVLGSESRTVSAHSGNNVTIIYQFVETVDGQSVDAYPGCDGRAETCRDKYDNINSFLGFAFIPSEAENPAVRVSW